MKESGCELDFPKYRNFIYFKFIKFLKIFHYCFLNWFSLMLAFLNESLITSFCIVIQSLSHIWLFATPWTAAHQPSLCFSISWSLLRLMSIESEISSNHLFLHLASLALNLSHHQSSPMCQLFALGGQSIGVLASVSLLPVNVQDWFPLGLTDLISLQSKELFLLYVI